MATIDSLESEVRSLESRVNGMDTRLSSVETKSHNNEQKITSILSDIDALKREDTRQQEVDKEHDRILKDHEGRLTSIENDVVEYQVEEWRLGNEFKYPAVNEQGEIEIYLPRYSKSELKECNEDIPGIISYKWYQKLFNPREQGDVSFDFAIGDFLKSINIGPHAVINLPIPVVLLNDEDSRRRYFIESAIPGLVLSETSYNPDVDNQVVTIYNFTNGTINIQAGEPVFKVSAVYGYPITLKIKQ